MRFILRSWACWTCLVVIGVVWGLPRLPHYQAWMSYGHELGGLALVVIYLAIGFSSLGLYGLAMGTMNGRSNSLQTYRGIKIGSVALSMAIGLVWCYLKLMDLTLI